jgi:hypothetical protein
MKRTILLVSFTMLIGAGITAQNTDQTETQTRMQTTVRDQTREQSRIQQRNQVQDQTGTGNQVQKREKAVKQQKIKTRKANHGEAVSETARSGEPGTGRGEVVRTRAKTQGTAMQSNAARGTSAKNQSMNQGARGVTLQRNSVRSGRGNGAGSR